MTAPTEPPLFIGWQAEIDRPSRRFLLNLALGLGVAGVGLGGALAAVQNTPGAGTWDQGALADWPGMLVRDPYPHLRTFALDGTPRTAFLATNGKTSIARRIPEDLHGPVVVRATPIVRDKHFMLAAVDGADWIRPADAAVPAAPVIPVDIGMVQVHGEILDAKCWFGAMRPGYGKSHKACAALCARGGLPLAFCIGPVCGGGGLAPLLLDQAGRPHGRAILPYVADPVRITGRYVQAGDVIQLQAPLSGIVRV